MENTVKQRRKRGGSPRGNFEDSKREALAVIEEKQEADRRKSESLKKLRLLRDNGLVPPD
jgi:hypothetical protein